MRDGFSHLSSLSRFERGPTNVGSKVGPAHAPSAGGNVKSRKESHTNELSDVEARRCQSLLPIPSVNPKTKARSAADNPDRSSPHIPGEPFASVSNQVEVIDVDAIDPDLVIETTADLAKLSPYKPCHGTGMSSISSTGRLERQLYSALGEELGSFEQQMNTTAMGPELTQALSGTAPCIGMNSNTILDPTVGEFEPVAKRKRQGTLGGERGKSPLKKKEKARLATDEDDDIPENMPRLRGD